MSAASVTTATLVVVPQREELEPLAAAFAALGHVDRAAGVGRLEATSFDALDLSLAVGGHGKAQFAVQTQYLLGLLPGVSTVICAGAAGALGADVQRGDVVVGTRTVEHDYTLRFSAEPVPVHPADRVALRHMRTVAAQFGQGLRLRFGAIASGDEDIVDADRARELRKETGALCVAWEGAGGARAARFSRRRFLEVRVITDSADDAAARDYRSSLGVVVPNLAAVLAAWALEAGRCGPPAVRCGPPARRTRSGRPGSST